MVHALEESRRVLARNGRLIDIRPLSSYPPVVVITEDGDKLAGRFNDSLGIPDDQAANNAIADAVRQGIFFKDAEEQFEFFYYWDTVEQMQAYVEDRWEGWVILENTILQNLSRIISESKGRVQMRVSLNMLISVYGKRG